MLTFIRNHPTRPGLTAATEHASWIVIAAAERLAGQEIDPIKRGKYSEIGRRMLQAIRSPLSDVHLLRAASPTVPDTDGVAHPMIEVIERYHNDPDLGVHETMKLFFAADSRSVD